MRQFQVVDVFKHRLNIYLKDIYKLYKSAIDWVTWLYIIIPFTAILCYNYYKLWIEPWEWNISAFDGLGMVFLVLFSLITNSNIRYFLESGDQLFFRQYEKDYRNLMKYGLTYSSCIHVFIVFIFFVILAPVVLVQFGIDLSLYICLFFVVLFSRIFVSVVKQLIGLRFQGWKFYFVYLLFIGLFGFGYGATLFFSFVQNSVLTISIAIVILVAATAYIVSCRLSLQGTFEKDMKREMMLKYRFLSFALQGASLIGAPKFQRLKGGRKRKRPWTFRKSGTIFKERTGKKAYLELHIKYILRNKSKWIIFIQLLGASIFALLIAPTVLKWVIWGLVIIIFNHMNRSFVNEINRSTFLKSFHWNEKQTHDFSTNSIYWTNLPFMIIIGAWIGVIMHPVWWGIFIFIGATVSISYFIQYFTL